MFFHNQNRRPPPFCEFFVVFLLFTAPAFQLLLSRNGVANLAKPLEINKARNVVLTRESRDQLLAMLKQPALQIIRDADVEHPRRAGEDVHVIIVHAHYETEETLRQAQGDNR